MAVNTVAAEGTPDRLLDVLADILLRRHRTSLHPLPLLEWVPLEPAIVRG
jgi:hypothetical protein